MKPIVMAALLATGSCLALSAPTARAQTAETEFNIPAQRLADALRAYSEATGRDVIAASQLLEGRRSSAVHGRLSPDEALTRLLAKTGLVAKHVAGSWVLQLANNPALLEKPADTGSESIVVTGSRIRGAGPVGSPLVTLDRTAIERSGYATVQQLLASLPQNFGGGPTETTLGATTRNGAGSDATYGSSINLRGLGPSSTLVLVDGMRPPLGGTGGVFADISLIPVSAVERIEILTDGASAIYGADAVAGVVNVRLRKNFEGTETMLRAGTADADMSEMQFGQLLGKSWGGGHAVIAYQFSQRGALAAAKRPYAREDLRRFGGGDYRSLYGSPGTITAADGRVFGIPAGQDGTALSAADLLPGVQNRRDNRAHSDLLPRQRVHSFYAGGEIEITERLSIHAKLLAAERRYRMTGNSEFLRRFSVPVSNPYYVDPIGTNEPVLVAYSFVNELGPQINTGRVRAISASAGLEQQVGDWRIELTGGYGKQKGRANTLNLVNSARLASALADTNPSTAFNIFGDGRANNPATIESIRGSYGTIDTYDNWSAALRVDGPLARLPAGNLRLAAGIEYRREAYDYFTILDLSSAVPIAAPFAGLPGPRRVKSIYGELMVPIFGPDNRTAGVERLDVSLAGRLEDYNQFGRTANPKLGVRWDPVHGLAIRGSFGTSFRAPHFDELLGSSLSSFRALRVDDPASPTGTSNVVGLFGYAPDIGPEKATSWTVGVDIAPPRIGGVKVSLTYYDVNYKDRIGSVSEDYLRFLVNRDLFAGVITDNPLPELVQSYFAMPGFINPLGIAPSEVVAIIDGRTRNLSAEHQRGLDFELSYAPEFAGGTVDAGVTGTHIFSIKRTLTEGARDTEVAGLYASPVKWRVRGRMGWSKGGFSASAFINYTGGYRNQLVTPTARVSPWTTVDLTIVQAIGAAAGEDGRGLQLALSLVNLFDRDPPFAEIPSFSSALGYDPEKANPLGRMASVQARIRW